MVDARRLYWRDSRNNQSIDNRFKKYAVVYCFYIKYMDLYNYDYMWIYFFLLLFYTLMIKYTLYFR